VDIPLPVLGSYFKIVQNLYQGVGSPSTQIAMPNSQRWCITMKNFGTGQTFVGNFNDLVNNPAYDIYQTTLPMDVFFDRHGAWCQLPWYAFQVVGSLSLSVCEIFYQPPPGVT